MEGIGYNVLKVTNKLFELKGIPFGVRNASGMVEAFNDEVIDEIYCQHLGVDEVDDYESFIYVIEDGVAFHIGVPKKHLGEKPVWRDIFNAPEYIMTLVIDNKPQIITEEAVILAANLIRIITEN